MSALTTSTHATRTMTARERLSRWRRRQRALRNADRDTCAAMLTRLVPCNTPLQSRFVNGETLPYCPTCERRRHGICVACTKAPVAGVTGKALYCALCKKLKRQEADAKFRAAHRAERAAAERARLAADPERRARHKERSRLVNLAMPQKAARWRKATIARRREKRRAYDAARRQARAAADRERRALRKAGLLPPRTCVSCPTIMTGRARKCDACRARHRIEARAALAALSTMERAA